MNKLNESDWVALRLLYIVLASDPSAAALPDVQKAINFYEEKLRKPGESTYARGNLLPIFAVLNREIANDGKTFNNPEVSLTRNIDVRWGVNAHG